MNQEKIGKLIASTRKSINLTQVELATKLGVSDKSVSKWENGKCLPDVSLYKDLCNILGITLNEFFAGERIKEEEYIKKADENLFKALEHSAFTIKEKIVFLKKKWQQEHFFELTITMIIIVGFIIYGFIKDTGIQYLFIILGFVSGILENNRMMAYIEKNVYGKKEFNIEEFHRAINNIQEFKTKMQKFTSKGEALNYLVKETNLSKKECSIAYDFIMNLDIPKKH